MRQNPDLTRSDATGSTLRPKCPQSHSKKSKQGSAVVVFTEIPVSEELRDATCPISRLFGQVTTTAFVVTRLFSMNSLFSPCYL
jgi:hypothetical protein